MIESDAVYLLQNNWKKIILYFSKVFVTYVISYEGLEYIFFFSLCEFCLVFLFFF